MEKVEGLKMKIKRKSKTLEMVVTETSTPQEMTSSGDLSDDQSSASCQPTRRTKGSKRSACSSTRSSPHRRDFSQNTSVGTVLEPECLGPCEPGTSILLDGIVWLETATGMLVVNVTWRGRTYVGTLLDSSQHTFAPPPPAQEKNSSAGGNGKRRRRPGAKRKQQLCRPAGSNSEHQLKQGRKPCAPCAPVVCPHPGCSKRFANVTAMKFHHNQTHTKPQTTKDGLFKIPVAEAASPSCDKRAKPSWPAKKVSSNENEIPAADQDDATSPYSDISDDNVAPVLERVNKVQRSSENNEPSRNQEPSQPPPLISVVSTSSTSSEQGVSVSAPVSPCFHGHVPPLYRGVSTGGTSNTPWPPPTSNNTPFFSPEVGNSPTKMYELAEMREAAAAAAASFKAAQMHIHQHQHHYRPDIFNPFVNPMIASNSQPHPSSSTLPHFQMSPK